MLKIERDIQKLGGIAARWELFRMGHWRELIDIAVTYGTIVRIRKGHYALPGEQDDVVRAWRIGGQLACRSALAYLNGERQTDGVLHVAVASNTARLHSPDQPGRALSKRDAVVVHWTGFSDGEDRRSVPYETATTQAASCAIRYRPRQGSSPAEPLSGLSPPRRK